MIFPPARNALSSLFDPQQLAVVGASDRPDALGQFVLRNILDAGFRGECFAVNPKHTHVLGMKSHASLADLPMAVDLAVITSPAASVPGILEDAGRRGVPTAVVLGAAGDTALQNEIRTTARRHAIRLLGPNSLGIARPGSGLNATFARAVAKPGAVALLSQSGAICSAILDLAATEKLGFSSVISLGSGLDVDFDEVLDYLREDSQTEAVLLYIEGVHEGRGFAEALRRIALEKPVIVMKAGRYASGSKAASSHSGALMGRDEVFNAVLHRCGAVRVDTYTQLVAAARALSAPRQPAGERLGLLTNGGGLAVIAADAATQYRIELATLEASTVKALDAILPSTWSHANPIDIIGDAPAARFGAAIDIALRDPSIDAVLALYCPTVPAQPAASAQAIADAVAKSSTEKPVLAAWLDRVEAETCSDIFESHGIPHFESPEDAVEAFSLMTNHHRNQARLRSTAPMYSDISSDSALAAAAKEANDICVLARNEGRILLNEVEAKNILRVFGLPVPAITVADSRETAIQAARTLGFPAVLKIHSPDIVHKSDVDGVLLDLENDDAVGHAFDEIIARAKRLRRDARIIGVTVQPMIRHAHAREAIIGVSLDSTFGPVISFGTGGVAVEIIRDTAVAMPPLDETLAAELVSQTRLNALLNAYRNVPAADLPALYAILVRVSLMTQTLSWLREMDLNPVLVHPEGATLLDARMVIA
ncbi:MAG TPA: acetate--CoA ligase family protein [Rhodocyclaceae bacterium]|nr:acetate--CoA ligase family protein [Rhodocyclaceae bacterium]